MKTKPKRTPVPPGWRKLKIGERPQVGDMEEEFSGGGFARIDNEAVCETPIHPNEFIIRRLPRKAKK